jgi:hypothetical protein
VTTAELTERLESVWTGAEWIDGPDDERGWELYDAAWAAFADGCRGHWLRFHREGGASWECRVGHYADGALWVSRGRDGREFPWSLSVATITAVDVLAEPAQPETLLQRLQTWLVTWLPTPAAGLPVNQRSDRP